MGKLFGTDGIRGIANEYPMTAEMALNIGRATAHLFKKKGHVAKVIVGKDTRISGYMFESALVSGICSMGVNAIMVGVMPTPVSSYPHLTILFKITASRYSFPKDSSFPTKRSLP